MVWYLAGFRSTPLRCEADINEKAFNFMDTSSGCSFERYCRFVSCFTVVPNSVIDSTEKLHALIMKDLETTPTRCGADIDGKVFNFMHTSS
jgi:hypothetical protein